MKNQVDIIKDIADGMAEIGGIPSNEEFYAEFDCRVRGVLKIKHPDISDEIIEVLNECIETIKAWHGNTGWQFYQNSPEMKKIYDLISKLKKWQEHDQ